MPLLEKLLSKDLPLSVFLCGLAVTIFLVTGLLQSRKQGQRLNALGSRAKAYPSNLPFSK